MIQAEHPLVADIARCLGRSPEGVLGFRQPELEVLLRDRVLVIDNGAELYGLCQDLFRFAVFLAEEKKATPAAEALAQGLRPVLKRLESLALSDRRALTLREAAARRHAGPPRAATPEAAAIHPASATGIGLRKR